MANRFATFLESALQDLRYATRGFRRAPVFTVIAILTLAIGIGATTAVFSVVDPLLFRSLPYGNPDRLVSWGFTGPIDENEFMVGNSYVKWRSLLKPFQSVTSLSASLDAQGNLGDHDPVRVTVIQVEANFLSAFGLTPAVGRDFTRDDDRPNAPKVALIAFGQWRSRYGGRPTALNQTVILDDQPTRIIGVLPQSFEMPTPSRADVLIPQQMDETAQLRGATRFLRTFARLKDGISIAEARRELRPFLENTVRYDVPPSLRKEVHLLVRSVRGRQVGNVRLASWMLFAAVLALLSIACANVANLLLARAAARGRELAMRAALGAGRRRLVQQTLTESLLLSICGGAAGCVFAAVLLRALIALAPQGILRLEQAKLDFRVLLFTLITSVLAAVLFGLAPAFERPRAEALTGWRATGGRTLLRHLLVAGQMAISLVLLAGALLFVRSLRNLQTQAIGLEPSHTVIASLQLGRNRYTTAERLTAFYNQLESRLQQIPGVTAFALSDSIPPAGWMHTRPFSNMAIIGKPPLPSEGGMVTFRYVSPDYFRLLHIPVLVGRPFDDRDRTPSLNSIILSAKLSHRMFGNENPLGQRILLNPQGTPLMVVGVTGDVKNEGLANSPNPEYYLPRKRSPDMGLGSSRAVALFRTPLSTAELSPWIRAQLASVDPRVVVTVSTMREHVADETDRPRFLTVLVALFAAFGLVLAAVGLYGVMALLVSQQTREIGIRMAVGATPAIIARYILKHAATWTAVGALAGLAGSFALARLTRGLLFEISPYDPLSMLLAASVLALAALVACWWPSYRASKVDPAVSLRYD